MTLILTYDLDIQSPASYGHGLLTCKGSRSADSRFRRQSGNKRTDRRTAAIALSPSLMRSVTKVTKPRNGAGSAIERTCVSMTAYGKSTQVLIQEQTYSLHLCALGQHLLLFSILTKTILNQCFRSGDQRSLNVAPNDHQ